MSVSRRMTSSHSLLRVARSLSAKCGVKRLVGLSSKNIIRSSHRKCASSTAHEAHNVTRRVRVFVDAMPRICCLSRKPYAILRLYTISYNWCIFCRKKFGSGLCIWLDLGMNFCLRLWKFGKRLTFVALINISRLNYQHISVSLK